MEPVINYKYEQGKKFIFPANHMIANWQFEEDEEKEAVLAQAVAEVAEKNELTINDIHKVYPFILRMLKSKSVWAE